MDFLYFRTWACSLRLRLQPPCFHLRLCELLQGFLQALIQAVVLRLLLLVVLRLKLLCDGGAAVSINTADLRFH